ncbi:hypothetical protein PMAYCL1PPCAC_12270, partial [Pristionchus mayeri]
LHHLLLLVVHTNSLGHGRDEGEELLTRRRTHSTVPLLQPSRDEKSPEQEVLRVVESEHVVVVLDVVLIQQSVHLVQLSIVLNIDVTPFESFRKRVRFLAQLLNRDVFFNCLIRIHLLTEPGDRLCAPESIIPLSSQSHITYRTGGSLQEAQFLNLGGQANMLESLWIQLLMRRTAGCIRIFRHGMLKWLRLLILLLRHGESSSLG